MHVVVFVLCGSFPDKKLNRALCLQQSFFAPLHPAGEAGGACMPRPGHNCYGLASHHTHQKENGGRPRGCKLVYLPIECRKSIHAKKGAAVRGERGVSVVFARFVALLPCCSGAAGARCGTSVCTSVLCAQFCSSS